MLKTVTEQVIEQETLMFVSAVIAHIRKVECTVPLLTYEQRQANYITTFKHMQEQVLAKYSHPAAPVLYQRLTESLWHMANMTLFNVYDGSRVGEVNADNTVFIGRSATFVWCLRKFAQIVWNNLVAQGLISKTQVYRLHMDVERNVVTMRQLDEAGNMTPRCIFVTDAQYYMYAGSASGLPKKLTPLFVSEIYDCSPDVIDGTEQFVFSKSGILQRIVKV